MDPPRLAREKRRFRASLGGQASLMQARATPLRPLHPRALAFPTTPSPHPSPWHRPTAAPAPPLLPRVAPPSTPCRHLASPASPNTRRRRRSAGRAGGVSSGARHAASVGGASEGGQERRQAVRHGRVAVQRHWRGSALSLASPLPSPRRRRLRSALSRLLSSSAGGSSMVVVGSAESFASILSKVQDEKLSAVFYYTAVWCGPCRAIAPVIAKLSSQYPKIPVYKVDIDMDGLGGKLSGLKIFSVPTFHFYHKGQKTSGVVGADVKKLEAAMESLHKQQ